MLPDDSVGCTYPGKLCRLRESVKNVLAGYAAVKLGYPGIESVGICLSSHKCSVESVNIFLVTNILTHELITEKETVSCACTGVALIGKLGRPCHQTILIGISAKACGIKPGTEIDRSLTGLYFNIWNSRASASYTECQAEVRPLGGIDESLDDILLGSTVIQSVDQASKPA